MTTIVEAQLMYALYFQQQLVAANTEYKSGNDHVLSALSTFDNNKQNILAAQQWLAEYSAKVTDDEINNSQTSRILVDLCNAYPDSGAYIISLRLGADDRIQWLQAGLNASRRLKEDRTTQSHLGNLGLAYCEIGYFSTAIEFLKKALTIAEQLEDDIHKGAWLGNLGNVYAATGDHQKAIHYHKNHLKIVTRIKDKRGQAHALINLGVSFAYLGQYEKALSNYQDSLRIAKEIGDRRDQSVSLLNIGLANFDLQNLEDAEESFHAALVISKELDDLISESMIMGGLADVYIEQKEYQTAITTLKAALYKLKNTYHDIQAEMGLLHSLGNAYNASEDYSNALNAYAQQFVLAESTGAFANMADILANRTSVFRALGDIDSAMKSGLEGLKLVQQIGAKSIEAFIRWQLGLIYESQGAKEKAIMEFEISVQIDSQIGGYDLVRHQDYFEKLLVS